MNNAKPFISVIIPCHNEEKYISDLLTFLQRQDYPLESMEIFIVDGMSTDNTVEIIKTFQNLTSDLKLNLLTNLNGTVPYALNIALSQSTGNPIIRLDAHTEYSQDYFVKIIETFNRSGADIVGGPMRAAGKTHFQNAVAYCTSTKFGVGNSSFHDENAEGYVDSVYLGAWKGEIFKEVGMFDGQLKRNQDDEFHYRAKSKGKRIYLNPQIKSWYYPRDNFKSLFKQYFQYGLYKPLVLKKVSSEMKARHFIPAVFTLYILAIPWLYFYLGYLVFIFLLIYLIVDVAFAFVNRNRLLVKLYSLVIYPTLHTAYGIGFVMGALKIIFQNLNIIKLICL
jgi:succinoglycan biosynthesis protein ExoA